MLSRSVIGNLLKPSTTSLIVASHAMKRFWKSVLFAAWLPPAITRESLAL